MEIELSTNMSCEMKTKTHFILNIKEGGWGVWGFGVEVSSGFSHVSGRIYKLSEC